jgi:DNA-binding XRE family transcriptional regulator
MICKFLRQIYKILAAHTRPIIKIFKLSFVRVQQNEDYLKWLGNNVKQKRIKSNMSQQELADNANVAKSTIQRIEKGELNPTITVLIKINDAIGSDICELIKRS